MKSVLVAALMLSTAPVLALDKPCLTKQKNAASYTLAQEVGVPVQGVEVVGFAPGFWTEAMGNNTGSDRVTVSVGNRTNRGMTIKTYEVYAKQVGSSDDCNILETVEFEQQ